MVENDDPQKEKPSVQHNQLGGTATFNFRNQSYKLPGTYKSHGDARKAAEDKCRAMGWRG